MPRVPRLPLVPDPLRRIDVPSDLEAITTVGHEEEPAAGGMDQGAVESIWSAARGLYKSGVHPAVQLCLRRNGRVLIDRAIGHARGNRPGDPDDARKVLATPETPFCVYSTSKGVTAMVVHMLHERGALDIHDCVATYIPEYACNGKGETTIAHVLSHRAGVPSMPRDALRIENVNDRELMLRLITEAEPSTKPGDVLAYHTLTGGFILAEVVARTTGKSIRDVLHDEILGPLGFRFCNYGVAPEDLDAVGLSYVTGPPLPPPASWLVTRALGAPLDEVVELSNDPRFLTAVVPSASVITSAHELSRFFEVFRRGGELDGVRVMRPDTVRHALSEQSRLEIDLTLIFPARFSYGLMLGAEVVSLYGLDTDSAFGHLGLINIMGWADPERGLSAALITSGKAIFYPELSRFYRVMQKIASVTERLGRRAGVVTASTGRRTIPRNTRSALVAMPRRSATFATRLRARTRGDAMSGHALAACPSARGEVVGLRSLDEARVRGDPGPRRRRTSGPDRARARAGGWPRADGREGAGAGR